VAFGDAWCHGVGEAAFSGLLAGGVGGGIGWWAYRRTLFVPNKAIQLFGRGEADVDRIVLPQGWGKTLQNDPRYKHDPLWWKEIDGLRHEVRMHPNPTRNNEYVKPGMMSYEGGVSRYGVQMVPTPPNVPAPKPTPGTPLDPRTQAIYDMDDTFCKYFGDQPKPMPNWGLHYLDPYGYAYVDDNGKLVGVATNDGHVLAKDHPWLPWWMR
jgi:hypothetical protein